jgi:hypothetical protein
MQSQQTINADNAIHRHALAAEEPEAQAVSQWFEPCLSCGKRFNRTATTITILCVEGRVEVCKVCPPCAKRRGLL